MVKHIFFILLLLNFNPHINATNEQLIQSSEKIQSPIISLKTKTYIRAAAKIIGGIGALIAGIPTFVVVQLFCSEVKSEANYKKNEESFNEIATEKGGRPATLEDYRYIVGMGAVMVQINAAISILAGGTLVVNGCKEIRQEWMRQSVLIKPLSELKQ